MSDDDNGLAVCPHFAQYGKKLLRFLRSENGGRLVQNENIRAAVKNFDDFHRLFFRHRHIVNFLFGIYFKPVTVCDFRHACINRF